MDEQLFYIWSFEHNGWWRPKSRGYTPKIEEAGTYPYSKALAICKQANYFNLNQNKASINESMVPVPNQ